MYQKIKRFLIDLLFPAFCLGCNKEGNYLCDDCKATLEILEKRYCLCDNRPVLLPINGEDGKCERCKSKSLSGLYFALYYKERALTRKLINFFGNDPYYLKDLAKTLSLLIKDHFSLAETDTCKLFENSVFVPLPKDEKEMRARGYSQSKEIAKELSKIFNVPTTNMVKGSKVFLVDDLYRAEEMESYSKDLREKGIKEIWGITVARQ